MQIRIGYDLTYVCPKPTPMIYTLNVHFSRVPDLVVPDQMTTVPPVPIRTYRDGFGNLCSRVVAPAGELTISTRALINDSGALDEEAPGACQYTVEALPDDTLVFLLGSRYCETDRLADTAWRLFGGTPLGWGRVQAICDYVHKHVRFGYEYSNPFKTAWEVYNDGVGVCRDFTHLAVAFCRCMNIPARYCTGYLSDIGMAPPHGVMDFAAWFEAYLDGRWYLFDPRNNQRRIGRVLIARGRDAADVAISNSFGENELRGFRVIAEEA